MNIILFDPAAARQELLPLTFTRPVALLRHGILTIAEKWQKALPEATFSYQTQDYLSEKYPANITGRDLYLAANVEPTPSLVDAVRQLSDHEMLLHQGRTVAHHGGIKTEATVQFDGELWAVDHVWDIFADNARAIEADFRALTAGKQSQPLSDTCTLIGPAERLFIAEGASVEGAFINTKGGSVYIGPDAQVMEGACLRGPLAMCEHSVVNMGGKIYGPTTLGPYCKVGGELNNVVMTGYSNKAHDGFLGNAVIGEWCNLGAGCTASNLKNTYAPIRLWSYATRSFARTGLQFCGLIMGDHSKAGINTMFNTATVVGVGVNFYGSGFPRTYIPSFVEGTTAGFKEVSLSRFFDTAQRMMERRHVPLTEADRRIFTHLAKEANGE